MMHQLHDVLLHIAASHTMPPSIRPLLLLLLVTLLLLQGFALLLP
jgi:hypothetical protein